jgi:hypothetical protein
VTLAQVEEIESAPPLRRAVSVWYATFGGVGAWTVHLMYLVSAEHWAHVHRQWAWTLHACTLVTALATIVAMLLARRLVRIARGADEASNDDSGQLLFLGRLGLLIGATNLALILLEGTYAIVLPHS